jgi:hypothetical protein
LFDFMNFILVCASATTFVIRHFIIVSLPEKL